jgi:lactate dehydrogenase-like 2-hydroxyacid dehydrogenase
MRGELLLIGAQMLPFIDVLAAETRVHRLPESGDQQEFLQQHGRATTAIGTDVWTPVDAELMSALPNLGLVANFGVGYDNVDVDFATAHGIKVTNTPGVLNDDVADLAIGLMLSVSRRIPQADRFVRDGRWRDGPFPLTTRLSGRSLGILGLGRIGKAVATRARGFGMDIAYHGRHAQPDQPYRYFPALMDMAREVGILVVLVPETGDTRGMVTREIMQALGPEGMLINVARGPIVDEDALVELLLSGELGSAGLDVYVTERHVPAALLGMDHVVLQPHVGSGTQQTRHAMGMLVVENLLAFLRGEALLTPVN